MKLEEYIGGTEVSELREAPKLGELLIKRGKLRRYQLDSILELQQAYRKVHRSVQLGELLVRHRATSPSAVKDALILQEAMPTGSVTGVLKKLIEDDYEAETKVLRPEPKL